MACRARSVGQREHNTGNMYQPVGMQGQHYDEESGLCYNRYRYYDPETGRYITQDPIGLKGDGTCIRIR